MPTYSSNLGLTLPLLNEYVNTWGDVTNDNLGSYLEQAITGYLVQPISTGSEVILTIPNGAAGAARNMYIRLDGTGGASTFLTLPTKNKLYFIHNNTAGAITVRAQGPTSGTSVAAGTKVILVYNGVDVVEATSYSATGGATGANPTALVGLTAVNGVAATFMRSDASPPIDQAITPTWTGVHTFTATITAAGMNVTGVTTPANGIYLPSPNTLGFTTNATTRGSINATGNWVINAPTSGVALSVNGVSGTHSTQIDDSAGTAYNAGYLEVPPNSQTTNYTAVLADSGKVIIMDGSSITATIPLNSAAAYPIGTVLTFININSSALSIDITATGTLYLVATTTTGTRTLSQYGIATAIKVATNTWIISGSGLS
jgi:hypothetical protein